MMAPCRVLWRAQTRRLRMALAGRNATQRPFLGLSEASYAGFRHQPARGQRKNWRRRDNSGAGGGSAGGSAMLSNRVAGSASR